MFLKYIKANLIPLIIEILFIISYYIFLKDDFIYVNAFFYVLLFVYFLISKDLNLKEWFLSFRSGKKYWIQVLLTFLGFMLAFILTMILEGIFPGLETGTINLRRDTWLTLGVFAISTILFPAITEETFYRKNLILFDSKKTVIITTILSMFLYACEHSLAPWGIFLTMIWALPLSLSYIKTRNIYVVMTAHFLGNLLGNGSDVIATLIHWLS
ncbi:type II CAAX endopeptidase family protein [Streptococcus equinus]|uniref:type II CAAX endopeptidase family protein n=1 Tax=Streptococcus equinus TaxID=1335 RepID=UPI00041B08D7|nr:type II CAAX endopeptidase family protein [Streptococcus equinus]